MAPVKQIENSQPYPRVAFVSAGQSPRPDILNEILELTGEGMSVEEFGALDDLDEVEIESLAPSPDEDRIYTRLTDGSPVVVAAAPLELRIANICGQLDRQGYDLIVVLSTGLYSEFQTQTPLLHSQKVMDSWFMSMSMAGCNLGVVTPLRQQQKSVSRHDPGMRPFEITYAMADKSELIDNAARKLKDCDLIFLHSVSYDSDTADRASTLTGRPVVTARNVLASALSLHLSYLARRTNDQALDVGDRLVRAAPNLTRREVEIVQLVVGGLSNKEAGRQLGISHRTVEKHRASAMTKLGVSRISELLQFILVLP